MGFPELGLTRPPPRGLVMQAGRPDCGRAPGGTVELFQHASVPGHGHPGLLAQELEWERLGIEGGHPGLRISAWPVTHMQPRLCVATAAGLTQSSRQGAASSFPSLHWNSSVPSFLLPPGPKISSGLTAPAKAPGHQY